MFLIKPDPPDPEDSEIMRRRALIAAALGVPVSSLPRWAASAATTPDGDHTLSQGTFQDAYTSARGELDRLGSHYVTESGMTSHTADRESGLWLFAQARRIINGAPLARRGDAERLAAEAAMFAAGCYLDFGHMRAATELYHQAYRLCGDHPDLRTFIACQAIWVPMYSGQWQAVLTRSESAVRAAERDGGYGLLMAPVHRAHAHAAFGNREQAMLDLGTAQRNIKRVPGCNAPHTALGYSETKVWFSSANAYAAMGDAERQSAAQHRALDDPTLGWMDRQLMRIGQATLDGDPEHAAHRIRFQLLSIPKDGFSHCVKAEAQEALVRLKAQQLTSRTGSAGPEVSMLGSYLNTVEVA